MFAELPFAVNRVGNAFMLALSLPKRPCDTFFGQRAWVLLGRKPHGLKSFRLGSPPRALMGSPHYQTCAGTPGWSGSSSQPRVTSARPLCPEGGVVGLPGTSPLGRPGCGIPWAWASSCPGCRLQPS